MGRTVTVSGTGFENPDGSSRANIIRRFVFDGMQVTLVREPSNEHDPNAVAIYIAAPRLFGLLGTSPKQIGYLSANVAKSRTRNMTNMKQKHCFSKKWSYLDDRLDFNGLLHQIYIIL